MNSNVSWLLRGIPYVGANPVLVNTALVVFGIGLLAILAYTVGYKNGLRDMKNWKPRRAVKA